MGRYQPYQPPALQTDALSKTDYRGGTNRNQTICLLRKVYRLVKRKFESVSRPLGHCGAERKGDQTLIPLFDLMGLSAENFLSSSTTGPRQSQGNKPSISFMTFFFMQSGQILWHTGHRPVLRHRPLIAPSIPCRRESPFTSRRSTGSPRQGMFSEQ